MKQILLTSFLFVQVLMSQGQPVAQRLAAAFDRFERDSQLQYAISALYVVDAKTGEVIFDRNGRVGLAGASTQKIVTAATAFELLGKAYRYETKLAYQGSIIDGRLLGNLLLIGSHDPSYGSWRWTSTGANSILQDIITAVKKEPIRSMEGSVQVYERTPTASIPSRWIQQDIGNYYGAGAGRMNWRENQFDVFLQSGNAIGDSVKIVRMDPPQFSAPYRSLLTAAAAGTGDNAYIFLTPKEIRGTIPIKEKAFKISGAMEDPAYELVMTLRDTLLKTGVVLDRNAPVIQRSLEGIRELYTYRSPSLDSLVYWFLRKSINLYGEAFLKTIAEKMTGSDDTDTGTAVIRQFWKDKGINENELNIYDGSGLSPMNRITAHAQVEVLKYAATRDWFPAYLKAFPEYNGMTMKSGTIGDVKGFCGYQKGKDGRTYIFSFLVNNYNGKTGSVVNKMYGVLDQLK